ncbi:hypothetical protein M408DRAFT_328328, partial [Serendipita vermifera MAFF 305830]
MVKELVCQGKSSAVNVVVVDVAAELERTGPFLAHDSSTHGRRQMQQKILKAGMNRLESIQPGLHDPHKEKDAIAQDDLIFQDTYQNESNIPKSGGATNLTHILLYDMEKPQQPVTIPLLFECWEVRRHLQAEGLAFYPELWARYSNRQPLTPNGYLWEHLLNEQSIQNLHVQYVNRPPNPGSPWRDYAIALRSVELPVPREDPVPIDLPFIGESCCGPDGCKDLWTHLEAIWRDQRVLEAKKINGTDVRLEKFDDNLLNARKNQLVVKVAM